MGWDRPRVAPPPAARSPAAVVAVLAVGVAGTVLVNTLVYPTAPLERLGPATAGLVQSSLVTNLALLAVVGLVLWRVLGLRARDIGLERASLGRSIGIVAGTWILIQGLGVALARAGVLGPGATDPLARPLGVAVGVLLAHLAVAAYEEVLYRGFLLGQCRVLAAHHIPGPPAAGLAVALGGSQAVFAVAHLPHRLRTGYVTGGPGGDLLALWLLGCTVAAVYLRTGSLWPAIGLHALYNRPVSPVLSPPAARALVAFAMVLVVLHGPRLWALADAAPDSDADHPPE